ncbi:MULTISPECIES: hypothetical protein [unclassified Pseudofrankia]|uniref:hypothetical protein n=1 Tax=unclassified Pseudofrankia TaxID=2994372 RepID=UPI0009F53017|nr:MULTISPECIES: hypothetical protein [unclassified Pseudofrankia]MDT3441376.1 hypothetical protein [Pseudofrankia sp. BMG5.37]
MARRVLGVVVALVVAGGVRYGVAQAIHHGDGNDSSSSDSSSTSSFAAGSCVKITEQPRVITSSPQNGELKSPPQYGPVKCDDETAYAKITALDVADGAAADPLGGTSSVADVGCPADTDEIVTLTNSLSLEKSTGCLRNLKAPHPGDLGGGGGLIRIGDCLEVYDSYSNNLGEVPCTNEEWIVDGVSFGKMWFGKIAGRVDAKNQCPPQASYSVEIDASSKRVLCVAKDGGWLPGVGDCVDANSFSASDPSANPRRRLCTDQYLAMQIIAMLPAGQPCPAGSGPSGLPGYLQTVCGRTIL